MNIIVLLNDSFDRAKHVFHRFAYVLSSMSSQKNHPVIALKTTVRDDYHHEVLDQLGNDRMILLTAHRRENIGEPMENMFRAIKRIVEEHNDDEQSKESSGHSLIDQELHDDNHPGQSFLEHLLPCFL